MKLGYSKCVIAVLLLFCPLNTQANCKCEQITSYVNGRRVCSCKPGYVVNSNHHEKCQDIDECLDSNETICEHICTNTIGSYLCSCNPGYKISISDPAKCEDIDECQDSNETICEQICTNTNGSYLCSCNPGYNISSSDLAKCEDINECSDTSNPCEQVCTNTIGGYNCSCEQLGYVIDTTNITQCKLADGFCNTVAGSNTLSGTITSPGYPQDYFNNYNCYVSLPPKQLMNITIRFLDFALENHQVCRFDSVTVYNGTSANDPRLAVYCGVNIPDPISSTIGLYLEFKTDGSVTLRGFQISYNYESMQTPT